MYHLFATFSTHFLRFFDFFAVYSYIYIIFDFFYMKIHTITAFVSFFTWKNIDFSALKTIMCGKLFWLASGKKLEIVSERRSPPCPSPPKRAVQSF